MKPELRWAEEAAADLEDITNYRFQNAPECAAELVREIYTAPAGLLTLPHRGREEKRGRGNLYFYRFPGSWFTGSLARTFILSASYTMLRSGLE
jgi:plasmid stabilization system protein ParE